MAKEKADTKGRDTQLFKMGDIRTAAKSTMEPKDYFESGGYPRNEGELLNKNFASRGKGK